MVIQENKDEFGILGLDPLSDLEKLEILKQIIDEFPNGHPLKRYTGEQYYDINRLSNLFDYLKRENISIDQVEQQIQFALNEFKNNPDNYYKRKTKDANKGDLKVNQYNALKNQLDTLKSACELVNAYNKKLIAFRRYDFNDMILWVLDLFKRKPEILLMYQEQFQYFLVDEYQDTNGSQNDLLYTLINYWDVPKCLCGWRRRSIHLQVSGC